MQVRVDITVSDIGMSETLRGGRMSSRDWDHHKDGFPAGCPTKEHVRLDIKCTTLSPEDLQKVLWLNF